MADFFRSLDAALDRAGVPARPRHAFTRVYLDAPSLQPERIPAHRAPKRQADRHEDSCGLACGASVFGPTCEQYLGSHRAERAS